MHLSLALIVAIGLLPQSAVPPCPADRPVDELIAEINSQTKRTTRNKNLLPDDICLFGWCSRAKRPHSQKLAKEAAKNDGQKADARAKDQSDDGKPQVKSADGAPSDYSSSKSPEAKCDAAMEVTLSAAHNVEVGDYYFEQKNFKAAFLRYQDAVTEKPADAAIHVRLGRVLEKLNDVHKAIERYQEAQKLAGPAKWAEEARSALQRLQPAGT